MNITNVPQGTTQANNSYVPRCRSPYYYCRIPGCRLITCPAVEDNIRAGLVKHDIGTGRIVLLSSAAIPNIPQGATIHKQVQEWHRQNPSQQACGGLGHMMLSVCSNLNSSPTFRSKDEEIEAATQRLNMLLEWRKHREVFDGVKIITRSTYRSDPVTLTTSIAP